MQKTIKAFVKGPGQHGALELKLEDKFDVVSPQRELASSACQRFDLIPFDALCVMADWFNEEMKIHGEKS